MRLNKNNIIKIILGIIFLILLFFIGFKLVKTLIENRQKDLNDKQLQQIYYSEDDELEIDSDLEAILNELKPFFEQFSIYNTEKTFYSKDLTYIKDFPNDRKIDIVMRTIDRKQLFYFLDTPLLSNGKEFYAYIDEVYVEEIYQEIFGNEVDYKRVEKPKGYYIYNKKNNRYEFYRDEELSNRKPTELITNVKRELINDKIIIEIELVMAFVENDRGINFYKNYDYTDLVGTITAYFNNKEELIKYIKNNIDKFNKYKHVFELDENSNYIYKYIERI